LSIKLVISD